MIKKTTSYQGLFELPVYILDQSRESPQYFNLSKIPAELTAGRNILRIKGNTNNLKIGVDIHAEILDANRQPIYYEIPNFVDDDGSRLIIIYIYKDTPAGDVLITLLGEAKYDQTGRTVPPSHTGRPNVKWNLTIPVNTDKRNTTEILFDPKKAPFVTIRELVRPYLNRDFGTTQIVSQSSGLVNYKLINQDPTVFISGSGFIKQMEGGTIRIVPTGSSPAPRAGVVTSASIYTAKIKKVLTGTEIITDKKYTISLPLSSPNTLSPLSFDRSTYSLEYTAAPTYSRTQNSRSFAYTEIGQLEPLAGDITRIKTFVKSAGTVGVWELVDDTVIADSEFQEILIDTGSINVKTRIGLFTSQSTINDYWHGDLYRLYNDARRELRPPQIVSAPTNSISLTFQSSSALPNSMQVSLASQSFSPKEFLKVYHSGSLGKFNKQFVKEGQYKLLFDAIARPSDLVGKGLNIATGATNSILPQLHVYMSGSAFDYKVGESHLGKKILSINIADIVAGKPATDSYRFIDKTVEFKADKTGQGVLVFKIDSGLWNFADISIKPLLENGYNPSQATLLVPLPTRHVNDKLDFKFEYYDHQGNQSKTFTTATNLPFKGGNTYIGGGHNLLTGSLFVANKFGNGVEIQGIHGGLVRSIGYRGYISASRGTAPGGFALWSGSVLFEENPITNSYQGVGLELHGGSGSAPSGKTNALRFRTDTGKLEITGAIVATTAIFQQYAIADYLGSRIINIDTTALRDKYFRNFAYNNASWSYLDLSGQALATESGMFVRVLEKPLYPITHIKIPKVPAIPDDKIGGSIYIQFSTDETDALETRFMDLGEFRDTGSLYTFPPSESIANLTSSNAIRNLSGSFSFQGFNPFNRFTISGMDYTGSLYGRPNAIYVWTKGQQGFGLTGTTNFDSTDLSLVNIRPARITGARRNFWIPAAQWNYNPISGSSVLDQPRYNPYSVLPHYKIEFDHLNPQTPPFTGVTRYHAGILTANLIIPEYILSKTYTILIYYALDTKDAGWYTSGSGWTTSIGASTSPNNTVRSYASIDRVKDSFAGTTIPVPNDQSLFVTGSDSSISGQNTHTYTGGVWSSPTIANGKHQVYTLAHEVNSADINSGELMNINLIIGVQRDLVDGIAAPNDKVYLRFFGARVIFDLVSNAGGFTSTAMANTPFAPPIS